MSEVTRKIEEVKVESNDAVFDPSKVSFYERFARLGVLIREKAKETLKFDSEISNIDYVYVDTQQYKSLVGAACDAVGIIFTCSVDDVQYDIQTDNKGVMIFIGSCVVRARFYDPFSDDNCITASAAGMGVSRGSGYALGIAQTNAMRNLLTNAFLIPTSDREADDVRENIKPASYLTDAAKAEKREELLEKTKSNSLYATIMYGNIVKSRIEETLAKDIPEDFRKRLEGFLENKYVDGKPIPLDDDPNFWIVKKEAATKILNDLDEV